MRRGCLILTFIVCYILFLQAGCQGKARVAEESKPALPESEPAVVLEKAKAAPEAVKQGPRITFEKVVHDFGKVGMGTSHPCEFKFTNTGDSLLRINKVQSSCSCTVAKLSRKEYAPGESGSVKVTKFRVPKRRGVTRQRLYVLSNDKKSPKVTLSVKAEVVAKVDYKPSSLNLLLNKENAGCPEITLTSLDNRPFSIKRFVSTGNSITADVNTSVKATRFVIEVKADLEKLQKSLNGRIDISLTHPESSSVTIPFKVLSRFEITPPSINILKAQPKRPVTREVWILNNYGEDFEIESASSRKGLIKVLSQEKIGNRHKFELQITPPDNVSNQRIFTDVFSVIIKGGEKLEIACRGFISVKQKDG